MGFVLLLSLNTNYYTYEIGCFFNHLISSFFFFFFFQQKEAVQSCGVLWYVVNNA